MKNLGTLKVTTPSPREILLERVFDAPKDLVFEAITTPELVKLWYGPHGHTLVTCEIDFRVGGSWRYVVRAPDGREMTLYGRYLEIDAPDRIVSTESMVPHPGETVNTIVLTESGGRTTFRNTVLCPSQEVRDMIASTGMEHGAAETFDRLNDLLKDRAGRAV